jgi:hypothetical protein
MTDRELLELAAKAAGLDVVPDICSDLLWVREKPNDLSGLIWNPLTDDGDALRLAVKLRMSLDHFEQTRETLARPCYSDEPTGQCFWDDANADPYAATRRAIVRAAAAIGRAMK